MAASPHARYDRQAAAQIIAAVSAGGLFHDAASPGFTGPARTLEYIETPLTPESGSHLTFSQLHYLEAFMRPCTPDQVTSATHRLVWTDSSGVPCTGHHGPSDLGPAVPIVARETVLALWASLERDERLAAAVAGLGEDDHAVLQATTTDHEPLEILRIGVEACGRALAQHSLLAHQTPHRTPAAFARAMRDGGLFQVVATTWYWELQASTYRRGMIPASLTTASDGSLRYTPEALDVLRRMKESTIADARQVMHTATVDEGLSVDAAIQKYHATLDIISKQYALLDGTTVPRCLASMTRTVDGARVTVLPLVVEAFVDTFVRMFDVVSVTRSTPGHVDDLAPDSPAGRVVEVPDMNCKHCRTTIQGVLEGLGVEVVEIDLRSKRVVAEFGTTPVLERAAEAIRDSGYTVLTERGG